MNDPALVFWAVCITLAGIALGVSGLAYGYAQRRYRHLVGERMEEAWKSVADVWAQAELTPNERRLIAMHMKDLQHYRWMLFSK